MSASVESRAREVIRLPTCGDDMAQAPPTVRLDPEQGGGQTRADPKRPALSDQLHKACFAARRGLKVMGATFMAAVFLVSLFGWPGGWIDDEHLKPTLMSVLFLVGLVLVVLEDHVGVNKAAVMLIVSASMWTFLSVGYHPHASREGHEALEHELNHGLQEVGSIILFLLPAMGVVESIDHFDGFAVVTHMIGKWTKGRKEPLLPILGMLCFFMSAVIDNLTATIVCLKLLRHAVGEDRHLRHTIGGLVVIAANAGGAWSPVGDVTTTMLWLANKITVGSTILWLFFPALVVCIVPLLGMWYQARREARICDAAAAAAGEASPHGAPMELPVVTRGKVAVLVMGIACILMVPVLKMVTGLPPYLGMLLALGILWFVTDTVWFHHYAKVPHPEDDPEGGLDADGTPKTPTMSVIVGGTEQTNVVEALHKMDLTGLLFFAGVLLAVGALDTAGVLELYAKLLVDLCGNSPVAICSLLGVSSAIVDNVPLVQAAINMFGESTPTDDPLWQLVALAAGTGGSILSVGSIAGVTLMTMEGVGYLWYCRRVSLWAAVGFALGIATYQLERAIFA
eukprot:CAMPEP_0195060168 /NCGR_PEP_ID=MMETSP0448-20130528/7491_1 /TAXON_ID=66468 /ORGANISM="Heterocapsa triquestra, Strain CCMP 448" /LENGTH=567 /DNA_ID=CAMNT_0040090539 /DNA_START=64 /DNA_END=1767 /DNA_ORIENTATION=+